MGDQTLSLKKEFFFSVIPTLLILAAVVALEVILRYTMPSFDNPFVSEVTIAGEEWYKVNRRYLSKYFPEERTAIIPEMRPVLFRKNKGPNVVRVFCLGESSMFGTPYEMTANIPAVVRKQLRHLYPEKDIEVINLGASAINSNVVLAIAERLPQYDPDLILIYLGHNEFYGPDGVGASFLQRTFPSSIPWVYELRDIRIFQVLQRFVQMFGTSDANDHRNLMETVSQNTRIPLASPQAERIFRLFRDNLTKIIGLFQEEHVPVIVSDVTSNLNFPPFVSDTLSTIANWSPFCTSIQASYANRNYKTVLDTLLPLLRLDSTNAFIQFWLGKTYEAIEKPGMAFPHLLAARDNDLLKFRAPLEIDRIIQQVTAKAGVPFISSDSLFSALSPGGIADTNLFWEHLHPNARGYYDIASLFVSKIQDMNLKALAPFHLLQAQKLSWNTDSLSICWLDLAYADISMRNLTTHWPFSNYRSKAVVIEHAEPELQQIAWNVYTYKLGWSEACYKSALFFQRSHQNRQAQTTYEALLEDFPSDFYAHYLLAVLLKETGREQMSVTHYQRSIQLNPSYPYPKIDLGLLFINGGDPDKAINQLESALRLTRDKNLPSENASIYYGLSAAWANKGELQRALSYADTSLRYYPAYSAARSLHDNILRHIGKQ